MQPCKSLLGLLKVVYSLTLMQLVISVGSCHKFKRARELPRAMSPLRMCTQSMIDCTQENTHFRGTILRGLIVMTNRMSRSRELRTRNSG